MMVTFFPGEFGTKVFHSTPEEIKSHRGQVDHTLVGKNRGPLDISKGIVMNISKFYDTGEFFTKCEYMTIRSRSPCGFIVGERIKGGSTTSGWGSVLLENIIPSLPFRGPDVQVVQQVVKGPDGNEKFYAPELQGGLRLTDNYPLHYDNDKLNLSVRQNNQAIKVILTDGYYEEGSALPVMKDLELVKQENLKQVQAK